MSKVQHHEIQSGKITWHVHVAGTGSHCIFAFHGFNRSYEDLLSLHHHLDGSFRIIAVSLFFHGSQFERLEDTDAFTPNELTVAFSLLVSTFTDGKYAVLGHSFGGRLALNMVEFGPSGLKQLFLLAPDALRYHPGYRFLTGTRLGRYLMGNFKKDPYRVILLIKLFGKLGIYSQQTARFFINQITHPKVRTLVYDSWMTHRLTIPDLQQVAARINNDQIRTTLVFGSRDTVIPIRQAIRFKKKIPELGQLHILDSGHRLYEKTQDLANILMEEKEKATA
ncbi:MAG: alpha/beta fold hydrolase [Bacteroidota bacterium]|jgi:pimeloyl-ACP methyl ester carboxylesterase